MILGAKSDHRRARTSRGRFFGGAVAPELEALRFIHRRPERKTPPSTSCHQLKGQTLGLGPDVFDQLLRLLPRCDPLRQSSKPSIPSSAVKHGAPSTLGVINEGSNPADLSPDVHHHVHPVASSLSKLGTAHLIARREV